MAPPVQLINQARTTIVAPLPGFPGATVTPAQIMALKNHVVACANHINQVKVSMVMSKNALAALPTADVEAVVVAGYPPPT